MNNVISPLTWFGFVAIGVYLIAGYFLLEGVKARSPELFEKLGRPHMFSNNTPKNSILVTIWLFNGDVSTLNRRDLFLYWLVRCSGVISLACFIAGSLKLL